MKMLNQEFAWMDFGLLSLPEELCNEIYEMLSLDEESIDPLSFQTSTTELSRTRRSVKRAYLFSRRKTADMTENV